MISFTRLNISDSDAQDLLWEYARRKAETEPRLAMELRSALRANGYVPPTILEVHARVEKVPGTKEIRLWFGSLILKIGDEVDLPLYECLAGAMNYGIAVTTRKTADEARLRQMQQFPVVFGDGYSRARATCSMVIANSNSIDPETKQILLHSINMLEAELLGSEELAGEVIVGEAQQRLRNVSRAG